MQEIRVLTLNIHKGFSVGNRRFVLEGIRDGLRLSGSNLVFLQEVIGENLRHSERIAGWPETDQLEFLADTVWDHYAYGKNSIYQHGHHGNAILSELPLATSNNLDVSTMRVSQRGILHGMLEAGVHLLCVHFGLFEFERRIQAQKLLRYLDENIPAQEPLVLAGDFNDWRGTFHRLITTRTNLVEAHAQSRQKLGKSFPAWFPLLSMDRIYQRGFEIRNVDILHDTTWRSLSDHCPLVADLRLLD